jgi:RimJ/RimL family protein N-acetyltransferase
MSDSALHVAPPPVAEFDDAPTAGADADLCLHTERLLLRPLRAADAPELHRLINDWEVSRNLA